MEAEGAGPFGPEMAWPVFAPELHWHAASMPMSLPRCLPSSQVIAQPLRCPAFALPSLCAAQPAHRLALA